MTNEKPEMSANAEKTEKADKKLRLIKELVRKNLQNPTFCCQPTTIPIT
jgi:hypothetical protein